MDVSNRTSTENIRFHFILKDDCDDIQDAPEDMKTAYSSIKANHLKKKTEIIHENEVKSKDLGKQDVIVLDEFAGETFEYLQKTPALIIGPRCLTIALLKAINIPLNRSPVFTLNMAGIYVTASGHSIEEKKRIKKLVNWMGGKFTENLDSECTHLISNTIKSKKYEIANENNIIVMHISWLEDVWQQSQTTFIPADTPHIIEKHKLPIFYKLNITSTGLGTDFKNQLVKLITENGGKYAGTFNTNHTDILLVEKSGVESIKYKAALKSSKDCLLPEWITDSVKKGFALPITNYRVIRMKASTPTKNEMSKFAAGTSASDFNPDSTDISVISTNSDSTRSSICINETGVSSINVPKPSQNVEKLTWRDRLLNLDLQVVKQAKTFLDDCCIYICGFKSDEKDKLIKILNIAGATRFDEINGKVTHVIVGRTIDTELKVARGYGIYILTLDWLFESLKQKQPAMEDDFIFRPPKNPIPVDEEILSPATKKSLEELSHTFKKPTMLPKRLVFNEPPKDLQQPEVDELLQNYSTHNSAPKSLPETSNINRKPSDGEISGSDIDGGNNHVVDSQITSEQLNNVNFLLHHVVFVFDSQADTHDTAVEDIETALGQIVGPDYKDTVDLVIVSSEIPTDISEIPVKYKALVNNLWLDDCFRPNIRVPFEYYHSPLPKLDTKPLQGMTVVFSTYSNSERIFITALTKILGADVNDSYVKKENPLLICSSPYGSKYQAAIKWGFPAVTVDWLRECVAQKRKVSLHPYLLGATKIPTGHKLWSDEKENSKPTECESPEFKLTMEDDVFLKPFELPKSRPSTSRENHLTYDVDPKTISTPELRKNIRETIALSDQLKRKREEREREEMGGTSSFLPRRVMELAGNDALPPMSPLGSPITDLRKYVDKNVREDLRECAYGVLKEAVDAGTLNLNPPVDMKTPPTPKIPEYLTTPEMDKRKWEYWDNKYRTPPAAKIRRKSTPYSEIKRRYWQEVLGDKTYNAISDTHMSETPMPSTSNSQHDCDTQAMAATNIHVHRFNEFIKNRTPEAVQRPVYETEEQEIIPSGKLESQAMCESEDLAVGWKDPTEFDSDRRSKSFQIIRRFNISHSDEKIKKKLIEGIKELRGEVCENLASFDPTCTHVICEIPNRSEKILSSIAAGKPILVPKYIEESVAAGYFLEEERFEWGNPNATFLAKLETVEELMANAAFRWRTRIARQPEKRSGAFTGFRVVLHVAKVEQFHRLLIAGGGVVISCKPPYIKSKEALEATHCLVETKKMKLTKEDHKAFAEAGVRVLSVLYLNGYLVSETGSDENKYKISLDS